MNTTASVLLAVITELADTAKNSMPKLRNGEKILQEWFKDDVYYRMTSFDGDTFCATYNFRTRTVDFVQVMNQKTA